MKPTMRKTWVEVTYWDCGNPDHRHKTEEIAAKCMEKNANKKPQTPVNVRRARWIAAMRAVICGATWKEAGTSIGVSGGRCQQIVRKVMRMSMHPKLLSGPVPDNDYWDVREARKQREFWLAQADVMAKEWSV